MVKADVKRDYYADLDLQYGAGADDIKKQFRKLAKLYHPDRNPGREVEFIAKFQAIQAANEILTDPEQKLRYDNDRRKAGHVPPVAKAAPPRAAANNFPPPPPTRRTPAGATPKTAYNTAGVHKPAPSAGSQRYAAWGARAGAQTGAQEWQNAKEEAQARAEAFQGFAGMKNGPSRGFPPPPPPRGGVRYVPTAQRHANGNAQPHHETPPKPAKSWEQFPSGQAGFPGMSRTQSTRRKQGGFDPSTPSGDEHMAGTSAYAGVHRGHKPHHSSAEPSYFDVHVSPGDATPDQEQPARSPLRHTRSHEDRPGLQRKPTTYANSGGEKTSLFGPGLGRSASVRNSPVGSGHEDRQRPHSHHGNARFPSASPGGRKSANSGPYSATYSSESSSSESSSDEEDGLRPNRPKATPRPSRTKTTPTHGGLSSQDASPESAYDARTYPAQKGKTATYDYPPPPQKNKPFYPDLDGHAKGVNFDGRRKSASHASTSDPSFSASTGGVQDLPKSFLASEWDGKFDADAFRPTPSEQDRRSPAKTTRRATTQSRNRTESPGKFADSTAPNVPASSSTASGAFQPARFDADKWAEQLKDHTWATPAPNAGDSKAAKRGSKSTIPVKKPSHSKPSNVTGVDHNKQPSASTNGATETQTSTKIPSVNMADAMDIDTPDDSHATKPPTANGTSANVPAPKNAASDSVNLGDLREVHPFKPSSSGLGDLDDLSSTLPFESRAAPNVKLDVSALATTMKELNLPKPPKAPITPGEESIAPGRWLAYVNAMNAYMKEWSTFNKRIVQHFHTRQVQMDHNMMNNWIGSIGDGPSESAALAMPTAHAGYKTYCSWLAQDAAVREWWNVACEKHGVAMMELGRLRERMRAASARSG